MKPVGGGWWLSVLTSLVWVGGVVGGLPVYIAGAIVAIARRTEMAVSPISSGCVLAILLVGR